MVMEVCMDAQLTRQDKTSHTSNTDKEPERSIVQIPNYTVAIAKLMKLYHAENNFHPAAEATMELRVESPKLTYTGLVHRFMDQPGCEMTAYKLFRRSLRM